jgi:hypothetical protein
MLNTISVMLIGEKRKPLFEMSAGCVDILDFVLGSHAIRHSCQADVSFDMGRDEAFILARGSCVHSDACYVAPLLSVCVTSHKATVLCCKQRRGLK